MSFFGKKRIFLDYASITPLDKRVKRAMEEYEKRSFANPSALYGEALVAKESLQKSREKVAELLNARESEIIFTSGGTESNNLALLGVFERYKKEGFVPHIITSSIEHSSILETVEEIKKRGGEVTVLSVSPDGLINPKDVFRAIKENTILVSIMYANNEIGTIQDIKEIGKLIRKYRNDNKTSFPYFHTDACQASLYLSVDVLKLGVDLLTLDGIKIYGPRGVGMLYKKSTLEILPVIFGGGQEKKLRSGTENVAGAVGFAKAMEITTEMREKESIRLTQIRDYAIDEILKNFKGASLNGSRTERLPNNINICFPGKDAEFLVISLDVQGIAASYSSSCRTLKEDSSSYVISALDKEACHSSSLRFSLGRNSQKSDIDYLVGKLKQILNREKAANNSSL